MEMEQYKELKSYMISLSKILYGEPKGSFQHPCIVVTKNSSYPCQLWDWVTGQTISHFAR
jgi:hypothetical protein